MPSASQGKGRLTTLPPDRRLTAFHPWQGKHAELQQENKGSLLAAFLLCVTFYQVLSTLTADGTFGQCIAVAAGFTVADGSMWVFHCFLRLL